MNENIRRLLGRLILTPHFLEISDLSLADLPPGSRERQALKHTIKIWEDERPEEINPAQLADRIGGNGAYNFVNSLISSAIPINAEAFQSSVRELKRKNLTVKILKKIEKQAKCGSLDLDEIEPDLTKYKSLCGSRLNIPSLLTRGSELQALELKIEWLVEKLIPERSIVVLYGPGGLGKTWCGLQMGDAVQDGKELFSLKTKSRPVVYVDFENSLPLLVERLRKLDINNVLFWHISAEIKPPKLDSKDYVFYKEMPKGSLIIFDTLRAAHDGDENSSKDMSLILGRLKELRELGFTILLNHHTGKADERRYKGSTAISDLADHVLSLHKVRKGTLEEVDDDFGLNSGDYFYLGTREKTRYEPYHLFLTFDLEAGGFILADDPDQENLNTIAEFIKTSELLPNQTEIFEWAKAKLGITKKGKLTVLLRKGEINNLWKSRKEGKRRIYEITKQ